MPGTAVREGVEDTEETLPNTLTKYTVDIDQSDTAPFKKEEPNTDRNVSEKRVANSLDTNEERSVTTKTFMSELKAEPFDIDPLGCLLTDDAYAPLKTEAKTVKADQKEDDKGSPVTNFAAKPRKTVAEKIAGTKPEPRTRTQRATDKNESNDGELKEAMKDFLKTAAADAVHAVVDARSALMEAAAAAKSGFKEV